MKKINVVGFGDESKLVLACAKKLGIEPQFVEEGEYRRGEMKLIGPAKVSHSALVVANIWEAPKSLFRVLSLAHGLRHAGVRRLSLIAPWIAYGRQDRPTRPGDEATGLMVGKLLSAMFDSIVTLDAHSEAFVESFKGKLEDVLPWQGIEVEEKIDLVAAPDHGAVSRASLAADRLGVPFIVIEKKRVGRKVLAKLPSGTKVKDARILLVDDMADSGETLKAAASVLKKAKARSVAATVSHTFDLLALHAKLTPEVDSVDCYFDHKSHLLAEAALDLLVSAMK
ncbi:MAG: ribose-phosphate diphosphokinase [Patescibacteria group bacterium]|nr:ribose-phosphate diphosphokinase [Patescibacteria group bacterium]